MDEGEVVRRVSRSASNYRNGIFCPAELWNQVVDRLTVPTVLPILSRLPGDLQSVLREAYAERPWSLRPVVGDSEVRVEVERWCKGAEA